MINKLKTDILALTLTSFMICCKAQYEAVKVIENSSFKSQYLNGKVFVGKTGQSCEIFDDGGCDIIKYDVLYFKKDRVLIAKREVSYFTDDDSDSSHEYSKIVHS